MVGNRRRCSNVPGVFVTMRAGLLPVVVGFLTPIILFGSVVNSLLYCAEQRLQDFGHQNTRCGPFSPHFQPPFPLRASHQEGIDKNDESVAATETTKISLQSILLPGTKMQTIGTPVGAVVLPTSCISSFHATCLAAFPDEPNLRFRGVEKYEVRDSTQNGDTDSYKVVHVSTRIAAALVEETVPSLVNFIHQNGGHFLPGARMRHNTQYSETIKQTKDDDFSAPTKFTFVELFAGVGGFRMGLEPIGGSCVLASEKDPVACAVYKQHFGDDHRLIEGDILDLILNDFSLGGIDLLTGGFPCQPFSARGSKLGLEDDQSGGHRGQLYLELVRILKQDQPKFFLFENVLGLVTMNGGFSGFNEISRDREYKSGRTMDIILESFEACGYKVQWHVVNAKHFCPQHRKRVYIFGSLLELDCPDLAWEKIYLPTIQENTVVRDYLEKDHATNPNTIASELTEQQWETAQNKCIDLNTTFEEQHKLDIDLPWVPTLISSYRTPSSESTKFLMEEADGTIRNGDPLRPRFLTPIEFRRLMGFPEFFSVETFQSGNTADKNQVDGNIYKVLGNAVVPPVVEAIGREILCLIEELESRTRKRLEKETESQEAKE